MFLNFLAHYVKNQVISFNFKRSGWTTSKCFHECLKEMIRCQKEFWKSPELIMENSIDPKGKWFEVCTILILIAHFYLYFCTFNTYFCGKIMQNWLGALYGTYIKVHVQEANKPRYRIRKNEIATNVLEVCSQDMQFIYVLPRWEGSTHDMCGDPGSWTS